MINVAQIIGNSLVNGPGQRVVIWLQGCNIGCSGCYNTDLWSDKVKSLYSPHKLFNEVMELVDDETQGITISGGEPTQQNLIDFLKLVNETHLDVIMFTGRYYEDIIESHKDMLSMVDLLIAGPYIESKNLGLKPLLGSANQQIIYLTDRISKEEVLKYAGIFEVTITDSEIMISGFPDKDMLIFGEKLTENRSTSTQ